MSWKIIPIAVWHTPQGNIIKIKCKICKKKSNHLVSNPFIKCSCGNFRRTEQVLNLYNFLHKRK